MIKKTVDSVTHRPIIIFFFPLEKLEDSLGHNVASKLKVDVEVGGNIPSSMMFEPNVDSPWMQRELPVIFNSIVSDLMVLSSGISSKYDLFFNEEIEGKTSVGFAINDNQQNFHTLLTWLNSKLEEAVVSGLSFRWFSNTRQPEASNQEAANYMAASRALIKGLDMMRVKRKHLLFPSEDHEHYPGNFDRRSSIDQYIVDSKPSNDV